MRSVAVIVIASAITGCSSTPQQVRETGTRTLHHLALPPQQAAGCVSRNADEYPEGYTSTVRALPKPDSFEVLVRAGPQTLFVMELAPSGRGSAMTMWAMQPMFQSIENEFRALAVKGC